MESKFEDVSVESRIEILKKIDKDLLIALCKPDITEDQIDAKLKECFSEEYYLERAKNMSN